MDKYKILDYFETRPAKFLVVLAFLGIAVSLKPIYESLDYDTGKKLEIYGKWIQVSGKPSDEELLEVLRKQVEADLMRPECKLEYGLSALLSHATYFPLVTLVYKFLAGGFFFLIVFGLLIFLKIKASYTFQLKMQESTPVATRKKLKTRAKMPKEWRAGMAAVKETFRWNLGGVAVWLSLGLANMAFPMLSLAINYVFLPSVLTLIFATGMMLGHEGEKRIPSSRLF